jgi:hypothetical protein
MKAQIENSEPRVENEIKEGHNYTDVPVDTCVSVWGVVDVHWFFVGLLLY